MKIYCSGKPAKSWNERRIRRRWVMSHVNYITKDPHWKSFSSSCPETFFAMFVCSSLRFFNQPSYRLDSLISSASVHLLCASRAFFPSPQSHRSIFASSRTCAFGAQCNERARARLFLQKRIWKLGWGKRNSATENSWRPLKNERISDRRESSNRVWRLHLYTISERGNN